MKVPGKVCSRQVTRTEKRRDRAEKKLFKFLLAYSKPSRAERKQYELVTGRKAPKPLTEKEREAWAKKKMAQIKGRGLPTLEMFMFCDLFEEWWEGQWTYVRKVDNGSQKNRRRARDSDAPARTGKKRYR